MGFCPLGFCSDTTVTHRVTLTVTHTVILTVTHRVTLCLAQFIEDILIFGGRSLRDPPWVPLESTNARSCAVMGV